MKERTTVFVYGTLKRCCCNHRHLAGQEFLGEARTLPGFRLYDLGGYPGMVPEQNSGKSVAGEVWSVDATALERLDRFEGVAEGLYRRAVVPLAAPFAHHSAQAYLFARPVTDAPEIGDTWHE